MSTFVLRREYALQMPTSYVEVDMDEMEYTEGGATYSGAKGWGAAAAMTSIGYGAAYFGSAMIAMLVPFGPVGWLIGVLGFAPISAVGSQLGNAGAQASWYMATKGYFTITYNNNPFCLFTVS